MAPTADQIRNIAADAGFDVVGFGPADPGEDGPRFAAWLDAGRAGQMDYLHKNREVILDPQKFAAGSRSTISLGFDYGGPAGVLAGDRGRVARYAVGRDYHRFLGNATRRIRDQLEAEGVPKGSIRVGTDAVPVLERALASRAGIGFLAKSSGIINPQLGPYLLLSELLTTLDLPPDSPATGTCGSCTACLDACPTGAITAPFELDARRCLSYTTIELRGFIPEPMRRAQNDWLFGCDICLEVCPFTSKGRASLASTVERPASLSPHRVVETYDLVGVLSLTEERYETDWTGTAMRRATRSGLRRNAAVVLGNLGDDAAAPSLTEALDDADRVVRGHAAWALGRLDAARSALSRRLEIETDGDVVAELRSALDGS